MPRTQSGEHPKRFDVLSLFLRGLKYAAHLVDCDIYVVPKGTGTVVIGNEGNVELGVAGQAVVRAFTPKTAQKYNCGTSALPFDEGWFNGGVRTKFVSAVTDARPTLAQVLAAFGAPAAVGQAFLGCLWDTANSNMWLCTSNGVSWYIVELTVP